LGVVDWLKAWRVWLTIHAFRPRVVEHRYGGAEGQVRVRSLTIDGIADRFGMPDIVFLDVEGAECMALGRASVFLFASRL